MTDKLDRRQFIKTAAAAGAAMSAASSAGPFIARAQNANERFAAGVIGCGGQGQNLMSHFQKTNRVDFIALCDVCGSQLKQAHDMTGGTAMTYSDYRKMLERKDLDAVIVATPDHWHALAAVATLNAGLDLYVEKPLALSIREGRRIVDAARKNNRVVQCGTFQRSGKMFQQAAQMVRDGAIGKVSFCRAWFHENDYPNGIGNPPDSDPPSDLDWNFWLGPAPYVPYNRNRCL